MKNVQLLEEATKDPLGPQKALEGPANSDRGDDSSNANSDDEASDADGMLTLPMTRIKRIVKLDPEHVSSTEAANYMLGVGAELFVMSLTSQAAAFARTRKRKKIQYEDFHRVVSSTDNMLFLKDLVPKTAPLGELVRDKRIKLRSKDSARVEKQLQPSQEEPAVPAQQIQALPTLPPIHPSNQLPPIQSLPPIIPPGQQLGRPLVQPLTQQIPQPLPPPVTRLPPINPPPAPTPSHSSINGNHISEILDSDGDITIRK